MFQRKGNNAKQIQLKLNHRVTEVQAILQSEGVSTKRFCFFIYKTYYLHTQSQQCGQWFIQSTRSNKNRRKPVERVILRPKIITQRRVPHRAWASVRSPGAEEHLQGRRRPSTVLLSNLAQPLPIPKQSLASRTPSPSSARFLLTKEVIL